MEIHLKYINCGIDSDDLEKSQLMFYSMLIVSIAGKREMILTAIVSTGCCFFRADYSTSCTQHNSKIYATRFIVSCSVFVAYIAYIVLLLFSASTIVDTYKAMVISSFSKLLAIPAYIWAGDWTSVLPQVLQVVTRFQVFKGN